MSLSEALLASCGCIACAYQADASLPYVKERMHCSRIAGDGKPEFVTRLFVCLFVCLRLGLGLGLGLQAMIYLLIFLLLVAIAILTYIKVKQLHHGK